MWVFFVLPPVNLLAAVRGVTRTCTGFFCSPAMHQYQPACLCWSFLKVTVKVPFLSSLMATAASSRPSESTRQEFQSPIRHHFFSLPLLAASQRRVTQQTVHQRLISKIETKKDDSLVYRSVINMKSRFDDDCQVNKLEQDSPTPVSLTVATFHRHTASLAPTQAAVSHFHTCRTHTARWYSTCLGWFYWQMMERFHVI